MLRHMTTRRGAAASPGRTTSARTTQDPSGLRLPSRRHGKARQRAGPGHAPKPRAAANALPWQWEHAIRVHCAETGHGGATTTSPDVTPPPAICENLGGGAVWGGRLEGVEGGVRPWGGGGGVPQLGRLRASHYYHMHTSREEVCLGVWGYEGIYVIIALSHLCREESLKGR